MKRLKFSEEYPKLKSPMFSTIRRWKAPYSTSKSGDEWLVETPDTYFIAKTLFTILMSMKDLKKVGPELLTFDTNRRNVAAALGLINSFYKNEIKDVTLMFLLRTSDIVSKKAIAELKVLVDKLDDNSD